MVVATFVGWVKGTSSLNDREKGSILRAASKILAFKLMQATAYEKLASRTRDERSRRFLLEISENERRDSVSWGEEIRALTEAAEKPSRFLNLRVGVMMRVLGSKGFLEWAVVAEDEAVEDLAIEASSIDDPEQSEKWARIASDERLHVVRNKEEILGMESWEMGGGGGVADVIFGANDGLVSILALVAGVYGAVTEAHLIFISGVAGAVAGAISMGAGAYLSSKSEQEVTQKENERREDRGLTPERQQEELVRLYQAKGLNREEAEGVAARVASHLETKAEQTIPDDLGLTSEESWPPVKAATLTGSSFAVVSLIPILPFAFMEVTAAVITAAVASIACLFAVGASKAIFTRKSWIRSGLEMMVIGSLAALATFLIGMAFPE
jgi:VIT1/CCC1 family predicted Fe2+/Mn2+ transporter/rubrerythrin